MKKNKKCVKSKFTISNLLSKFLLLIIVALSVLIILKLFPDLKSKIFNSNINLSGLNALYTQYFGGILPETKTESKTVSKESIKYSNAEEYNEGVKLTVETNYTISSQSAGLIIYVGNKDGYGNTVIVQRPDGLEIWYANLENINISLYDYIKQGQTLGTVKDNTLYMVFTKDGKHLNYKEYI